MFLLLSAGDLTTSFARDAMRALRSTPVRATRPSCWRCSASAPRRASCPLHVWLPLAHPAAPSHVSALMSGVMIKMGVYGLPARRRSTCSAAGRRGGAALVLGVGAVSAVLGVLYALMEHDLKRLLAYHSRREHRDHLHRHRRGPDVPQPTGCRRSPRSASSAASTTRSTTRASRACCSWRGRGAARDAARATWRRWAG